MNFIWDYGDGSPKFLTSSSSAVQHTYNTGKQDTFNVRLIANNSCGSDTLIYNIVVSPLVLFIKRTLLGKQLTASLPFIAIYSLMVFGDTTIL